jgi:protein-tyrosine phosphatase
VAVVSAGVVLFVCTGNTCRSPLAAAWAERAFAALGLDAVARSAGVSATEDAPASAGAAAVAREAGLDLGGHRARLLTRPAVLEARLVLTMGRRQQEFIAVLAPEAVPYTHVLRAYATGEDGDVSDPYGGDLVVYRRTLRELSELVDRSLQRWSEATARGRHPGEPRRLE